jgi:hypothetical protein
MQMVTSQSETEKIMVILLEYFPITLIEPMLDDIWNEIGQHTDNNSLRETIANMVDYIEQKYIEMEEKE